MPEILVNDRLLRHPLTGIGYYLTSLVSSWPRDADVRLVGFHSQRFLRRSRIPGHAWMREHLQEPKPLRLQPLAAIQAPPPPLRQRLLGWTRPARDALYQWLMRRDFRRQHYAAFFEPNCLPLCDCSPLVTTMSDLSVLECPQYHPPERVEVWKRNLANALAWTRRWICFSHATAQTMARLLGLADDHISVIPLASRWADLPADWNPRALRAGLGLPEHYIVAVGTIEPRKNLLNLLDAYARQPRSWRARTPLILVGMPGWGNDAFWRALREHRVADEVWMTGYLPDLHAAAVVAGARALFFPSFYEGFGLPVLEAMSLGVPVAASTAESVREICGNTALLVHPNDNDAWTRALPRLTEPGAERDRLIEAGRRRSAAFRWSTTAEMHHELFLGLALERDYAGGRARLLRRSHPEITVLPPAV